MSDDEINEWWERAKRKLVLTRCGRCGLPFRLAFVQCPACGYPET